jgi:hypothetical protein
VMLADGEATQEAPLPASARRRKNHQVGQANTTAHRIDLALSETAGHSLRPPRPTAPPPDQLTGHDVPADHDPREQEDPGHCAGTPACPRTGSTNQPPAKRISPWTHTLRERRRLVRSTDPYSGLSEPDEHPRSLFYWLSVC